MLTDPLFRAIYLYQRTAVPRWTLGEKKGVGTVGAVSVERRV